MDGKYTNDILYGTFHQYSIEIILDLKIKESEVAFVVEKNVSNNVADV